MLSRFKLQPGRSRRWLPLLLLLLTVPPAEALRIVLLSDFNGSYGSTRYPTGLHQSMQRILTEWKPELVISAGDLIAGQQASLSDRQVQAMWAAFDQAVYTPLERAGIPLLFTLGNHDASLPRDRREAERYWKNHVPALAFQDRSAFPFRYSVTHGPLFIAVLDATGPRVGPDQQAWVRAQLASPAAQAARFRLVLGHLPLAGVSAGKNKPGEVIREAEALRQIMEAGRVTAYIHGHHAAYYPGRLGSLRVLSSGGIGGRDYVGYPGTARSVVTVLDVQPDHIGLSAYDVQTGQLLPSSSLPERINGLGGPLFRMDDLR